jgi:Domain of unknown function (DUF4262)
MPQPYLDLPQPENDFDERLVADVRNHGWHCVLVADEHHPEHAASNAALGRHAVYDAAFAYTVGLCLTKDHPELVLVGRWQQAHAILAAAVDLSTGGRRLAPGEVSDEVLQGYEVRFGLVSDEQRIELLTYADWANHRRPFEALQLILPDSSGRWPEDPDYNAYAQPLLG